MLRHIRSTLLKPKKRFLLKARSSKNDEKRRFYFIMGAGSEGFDYDHDRLIQWPVVEIIAAPEENTYDQEGRIADSSKFGAVTFHSPPNGMYRKDSIELNSDGQTWYDNLGGSQNIEFNMFKAPIDFTESNVGQMKFQYNSHLSRSRMEYGLGLLGDTENYGLRKTKLYSADGKVEVLYDNVEHSVKLRTFIAGAPYSAKLYNECVFYTEAGEPSLNNKYYLHRDYLGSILAITNVNGLIREQRSFDPWGKLTFLKDKDGVNLQTENGLQFLDRGFTSHEHLQEVNLINMNGRLYDPMLMTFLMPDNFVQQPDNTQSHNRYAYVLNNPFKIY